MHRLPNRARRAMRALRDAVFAPRSTRVRVRVYLNIDPAALLTGYRPGAPVALAYAFVLRVNPAVDTDEVLLERVFAAFNDHPEHDDDHAHTDAWYAKRLRSLSVGDLVGLDDRHYTCQSLGWTPVPAPAS